MNYKKLLKIFIIIYIVVLSAYFTVPAQAKDKVMEILQYKNPVYVIYTQDRPITLSSEENYLNISFGEFEFQTYRLPQI